MLKGVEMRLAGAGQAKTAVTAPVCHSALVSARTVKCRQPFKSAQRPAVRVFAAEPEAATSTKQAKKPVADIEVGAEYEGRVVKVEQFGAFVDFGFAKDGLVHISQLSDKYVKSAAGVVSLNQTVKVKVMSIDASTGRVALTMKGTAGAPADAEEEAAGEAEADVEDEALAFEEEEDTLDLLEAPEGMELVTAVDEPEITYVMDEDDDEMTLESVAAFEAADPESIERVLDMEAMPVPIGELVTGKITRVEDYGVFLQFESHGKTVTALLEKDEAKVPAAALSDKQRAAYGEQVPEYVDLDFDDIKQYYQVGQEVSAFVLEYNDRNQASLTQFADWEVQADAMELADMEDDRDQLAAALQKEEMDDLAQDPLDLLEAEILAGDAGDAEYEAGSPEADLRDEYSALSGFGRPLLNSDLNVTFPSRPLNAANKLALNQLGLKDTDFDGDEIELEDFWQETIPVPKHALKRLGLKIQFNEAGEPEVVEKEGANKGEFDPASAFQAASHNARVAAFVKDLLADDADEAELPARAMRRPVVLAAAVQNIAASTVKDLRNKTGAGMMDCKRALAENDGDVEKAIEWLRKKGLAGADKKAGRVAAEGVIANYIHPGSRLGVLLEVNCETDFVAASDKFQALVGELGMIIASSADVLCVSPDDVPADVLAKEREVEMGREDLQSKPEAVRAKIVEGRIQKIRDNMALLNQASLTDPNKKVSELIKESIAAIGENIQVRRFVRYNLGEGLEKRSNDFAAEVAQQTQAKAAAPAPKKEEPKKEEPKKEEAKPAMEVSAKLVKQLRDKTGAGMMDCKRALAENNGDIEASVDWLRQKGLSSADKKAGRLAAEGAISAYIHPGSRLGVLLEVNCETDFVAASDKFQALVNAIAMQIAASPSVAYVAAEDIPAEVYAREKEIEMGREDLANKPEAIRAKIAEGRVAKLAQEMALLPQPFLMDPTKTVEQAVKEAIAAIGEKISIRRFVRYQLGEGIEKKTTNLAAEVAAATGQAA